MRPAGEDEFLVFAFPAKTDPMAKFTVVDARGSPGNFRIIRYYKAGETAQNFTERMRILNYAIRSSRPSIDLAESLRKQFEKTCPGIIWEVLKQQETEVLFEFKNAKCPDEAEFRGIGRTVAGQQNVFLVSYEVRGTELAQSAREEAINLVLAARVISGSSLGKEVIKPTK
jgi:hypothetical protein